MGTITIMGALGGFSGPWAYKGSQTAQGYPDGQIATLSLFCASILAYIILWYARHVSLFSNAFYGPSVGCQWMNPVQTAFQMVFYIY